MLGQVYAVAVVGDQPIPRAGLAQMVDDAPSLTVAATARSVDDLGDVYDVVLLDLPQGGRPEAIAKAARHGNPLVCAPWERASAVLAATRAGARGCVTRYSEPHIVRLAVQVIATGGFCVCPRLVGRFHSELTGSAEPDSRLLAPREVETLRLMASGLRSIQIASRMGLTQSTVNTYAKRIRAKLKVNTRAELIRVAVELGYVVLTGRSAA